MTTSDIVRYRLYNQQITHQEFDTPEDVVYWLGAVQAQDYRNSLWAIGLRTKKATEKDIEHAIENKKIVRTWSMRGTLHFVPAEDVRWMLKLLAPRIIVRSARRFKELELDNKIFFKSKDLLIKALGGGKRLTRKSIFELLEKSKIATASQRGYHILFKLAHDGLICFGNHEGKQPTFVLLDEWIPNSKNLSKEESLAEITIRYFTSHGPATLHDFIWWSGLPAEDARTGLKIVEPQLIKTTFAGQTYFMPPDIPSIKNRQTCFMLPNWDEYMVAYRDRSAALDPKHKDFVYSGNGIFYPVILYNGKVVGKWGREIKKDKVAVGTTEFIPLNKTQHNSIAKEIMRYCKFIGKVKENSNTKNKSSR